MKALSEDHAKLLKTYIQQSWGSDDPDRFPGPQPISIERRHFPLLRKQPYVVCEKTDGVRHMLACFMANDIKVCAAVDRAFSAFYVPMTIPRDTVLDGELTETKDGKKLYMVYDAVRVSGEDLRSQPLNVRLEKASKVVKGVIKMAKNPFEMRVKNMLPLSDMSLLAPLESFPYETDGLVFTPVSEPIRMGTHETLFKWKPRDRITIDFCLRGWHPATGWNLMVQDRGVYYKEAQLMGLKDQPEGTIVECGYGETGWFPVKIRTDKTYPNNRRTYNRTIVNIREDIQFSEFLRVFHI